MLTLIALDLVPSLAPSCTALPAVDTQLSRQYLQRMISLRNMLVESDPGSTGRPGDLRMR
jgi:hypothetical protein